MLRKSDHKYESLTPTPPKRRTKSREQALSALMRLCARAEKSEGDARRLMRGWGVSAEDAEKVLAQLVRDKFISNSRYAEAFVREKTRLSGWGAYKIRTALQRKGVEKEIIEEALKQTNREEMQTKLTERLQRKLRTTKSSSPYDLRTKLMRYGLTLGFDYEQVSEAVSQIMNNDEICDEFN